MSSSSHALPFLHLARGRKNLAADRGDDPTPPPCPQWAHPSPASIHQRDLGKTTRGNPGDFRLATHHPPAGMDSTNVSLSVNKEGPGTRVKGNVEWFVLHRTSSFKHTVVAPLNGAQVRKQVDGSGRRQQTFKSLPSLGRGAV